MNALDRPGMVNRDRLIAALRAEREIRLRSAFPCGAAPDPAMSEKGFQPEVATDEGAG